MGRERGSDNLGHGVLRCGPLHHPCAALSRRGTQLDGFAHQTIENQLYNCFKVDDVSSRGGFTKLGIEKIGALITRGVVIDVAGLKGMDILPDNYEITQQDLEQALQRQNLKLQLGDKSCPGIGVGAGQWLVQQDPMLVGSDNWPVEVAPNPDTKISLPLHQFLLVVNGILLLENLKLDELVHRGPLTSSLRGRRRDVSRRRLTDLPPPDGA